MDRQVIVTKVTAFLKATHAQSNANSEHAGLISPARTAQHSNPHQFLSVLLDFAWSPAPEPLGEYWESLLTLQMRRSKPQLLLLTQTMWVSSRWLPQTQQELQVTPDQHEAMLAVLWRGRGGLTVRFLLTPFCEIPSFKRLLYRFLSLLYLDIR